MSEKRTVWAVTSGDYSDYRVMAIFETETDAQAAREAGLGDDVTEMAYYPAGAPGPAKYGWWMARATQDDGGPWNDVAVWPEWSFDEDDMPADGRPTMTVYRRTSWRDTYVEVKARTEEAAIKACADKVAQLKAEALEPQ